MAPDPRPPTILSEFGDGYCRVCHFIVGLGADGLLLTHTRGAHGLAAKYGEANPQCEGSGKPPTKLTPLTSRLAAFSTKPRTGTCPTCGQTVVIDASGRWVMHGKAPGIYDWCKMSQKLYAKPRGPLRPHERNHGTERG